MKARKQRDRKRWRRRAARVQRQREWLSNFRDTYVCGWSERDEALKRGVELMRTILRGDVGSLLASGSV